MIDQLMGPGDEVGIDRQRAPFRVDRAGHQDDASLAKRPLDDPRVARVEPRRDRGTVHGLENPVFKKVGGGERRMITLPQGRQRRADERARRGMRDRLAATGFAPRRTDPGGQPARALLVKRRIGECRVDLVAQRDQDAAAGIRGTALIAATMCGLEPLDVCQNGHTLPFQIVCANSLGPDNARVHRDGIGTARERGPRVENRSRSRAARRPGSPSTSKTESAGTTKTARLDASSSASASSSPVRPTDTTCEPGSASDGPEHKRHFAAGRQRAHDLGRPRHGLAVDLQLGACRSVPPSRYSRRGS